MIPTKKKKIGTWRSIEKRKKRKIWLWKRSVSAHYDLQTVSCQGPVRMAERIDCVARTTITATMQIIVPLPHGYLHMPAAAENY